MCQKCESVLKKIEELRRQIKLDQEDAEPGTFDEGAVIGCEVALRQIEGVMREASGSFCSV